MHDSTVFIRLLAEEDKGTALGAVTAALSGGKVISSACMVNASSLEQVPGSPFAYWVSDTIRALFRKLPSFENSHRRACITNPAGDDQRYFRTSYEVPVTHIGREVRWVPVTRGGRFSPYYADLSHLVDWDDEEETYRGFTGTFHRPLAKPASLEFFFRPGITWPLRGIRFSAQALPSGCIFSVAGKFATSDNVGELPLLIGIMNSRIFDFLLGLFAGKVGGVQYEVGLINKIPVPDVTPQEQLRLSGLVYTCVNNRRDLDQANEISHVFSLPSVLRTGGESARSRVLSWLCEVVRADKEIDRLQIELDTMTYDLYGVMGDDREVISTAISMPADFEHNDTDGEQLNEESTEVSDSTAPTDSISCISGLVSYLFGSVLGRWDIRIALDPTLTPRLQDPFEPLPVCSPGMLVGPDALPATRDNIVSGEWLRARPNAITLPPDGSVRRSTITDAEYPLRINWDGILVDEPDHPDDIVGRVREVLQLLWQERAGTIEAEACELLGVKSLREFFRNPKHFWEYHVKRYSKSRRKAPIYWLLQSPKRNYGLWLYYHRLDGDLLFKALVNYVEPRIRREEERLRELVAQKEAAGGSGSEAKRMARAAEQQEALLSDLQEFRDRLERAAKLHLQPDLDDGVILNIAPLWELVPWKEAKAMWEELRAGKYEWSSIGKQLRERGVVKGAGRA